MKERPLLFSAPMVRALLDGTKTQTRRLRGLDDINKDPDRARLLSFKDGIATFGDSLPDDPVPIEVKCPFGVPGDRLWVRETWAPHADEEEAARNWTKDVPFTSSGHQKPEVFYRADGGDPFTNNWRPSIFMPRWASRITLELTEVRVQRLQDISEEDAIAEGIESNLDDGMRYYGPLNGGHVDPRVAYQWLWKDINGDSSWDANPWVWALSIQRSTNGGSDGSRERDQ
jgi:hypothetical protein